MATTRRTEHDNPDPLLYPNGKPVVIQLDEPLETKVDGTLGELAFYFKPKAKHFAMADGKGEHESSIILIAQCTGLLIKEARELGAADYLEACQVVQWFCKQGPCPPQGRSDEEGGASEDAEEG